MKRCVFILPWFGALRNYFDLFLTSCQNNDEYDWIILTDNAPRWTPSNVKVLTMSFDEFQRVVQSKFDFRIMIDKPYKICDFKPALGYIFEKEISGYEYWGHCDCDLIFGRLAPLLEPLFDEGYEKIFSAGHLTLYRNTCENNRRFLLADKDGVNMSRIALSNKGVFAFDEAVWARNVHTLFVGQGVKIFEDDLSFNVSTAYYRLRRTAFNPLSRKWEVQKEYPNAMWADSSGVCALYRLPQNKSEVRRYAYVHLQGRQMEVSSDFDLYSGFQIAPNRFIPLNATCGKTGIPEGLISTSFSLRAIRLAARRAKHVLRKEPSAETYDPYLPYL